MRFHPPIHLVVAAATVVGGLASYQGVDHLVLAKSGHTSQQDNGNGSGNGSGSSTSTSVPYFQRHHDTAPPSTTVTSIPGSTEPPPTYVTSTTVPHDTTPPSTTVTTIHTDPPTTVTTIHTEPPPPTSTTVPRTTTPPPTGSVPQLSLYCMSGFTKTVGVSKCSWSPSTVPNFGHYRLTRELVGTPRQTVFESTDQTVYYFYDIGLQSGSAYSYIIEAYDAGGNLIAQSSAFHITCCGTGSGNT